ncbi:MAG: MerR family DNA-binding transcriptional regulator [Candidatus Saccharibacteria bacterium]|nr:MerR family DNA-binding transcriptional regulator [Pseudorhodobacter sp.]
MNVHFPVLTVGALAKAVGLSTPTIRYYEDIGLIPPAGRTGRGQQVFGHQCRAVDPDPKMPRLWLFHRSNQSPVGPFDQCRSGLRQSSRYC